MKRSRTFFRTVYPNRNHVTTHPDIFIYNTHLIYSIVQEHSFNILCIFRVFKIAHLNLQMYDECSNMNAYHFKAFFIDMLWQNGKRF